MVLFNNEYTMTIGGLAVVTKNTIEVINPATEEVIGHVPSASKQDLELAISSARKVLPEWSAKTYDERGDLISQFGDAIYANKQELARLLTIEQGKPLGFAEGEIDQAVHWCKEVAKQRLDSEVLEDTQDYYIEREYIPLGVVGAIIPWNFPVLLSMFKIPLALQTGNTLIVKPSPYTPLCTLKIGEIAREIFPSGVFNVLSGGDNLGPWITEHPEVNKISFTGSTDTGKKVMQSAASSLKRVTLELGGNDAAIVLPDVDPKQVAPSLFWAAFLNSGQLCIASKRIYVHEAVYNEVLNELVAYAKTIILGDGLDPSTGLGPIQNKIQYDKVKNLIDDVKHSGLKIALGGHLEDRPGYFIPITIVDNPPEDSRVVQEEAFGPILPLLRYENYEEVIERANNSTFGLGGSVWGKDLELAKSIAQRLETGTVWINESAVLSPNIPFGGHKQSGLGIEGSLDGLAEYTNSKVIRVNKK